MRKPFHNNAARYPLEAFKHSVPYTKSSSQYVSSIRVLLVAVEDTKGVPQWRNFERVLDHYQSLSNNAQNRLQKAWRLFLAYAGATDDLPQLGLGQVKVAPLVEALRRLIRAFNPYDERGKRSNARNYNVADMIDFTWKKIDGRWRVLDGSLRMVGWTAPTDVPALKKVRDWAYPGGRRLIDGALFIPVYPGSDEKRKKTALWMILNQKHDSVALEELLWREKIAVYVTTIDTSDIEKAIDYYGRLLTSNTPDLTNEEREDKARINVWWDKRDEVIRGR